MTDEQKSILFYLGVLLILYSFTFPLRIEDMKPVFMYWLIGVPITLFITKKYIDKKVNSNG